MPFEYFMLLVCIASIGACIATPLIFRRMDKKHNANINKIGQRK